MSMSSTINVHRPEVEAGELGVYRSSAGDFLTITLASNSSLRVTMFATDGQWDAIVDRVAEFRRSEEPLCTVCGDSREWCKRGPYEAIHDIDVSDDELEAATRWVNCEECHELDLAIDQAPGGLCHNCAWRMAQADGR